MSQVIKESVRYQYLTTIRMNLLSLGCGTIVGWTSPYLPVLQSNESPLESGPITLEHASFIGSLLCIGAIIGTFLFGWITERYGTKIAGWIITIPMIVFWLLILFGNDVYELYIARFIGGFSGGGAFLLMPIYVVEIADDRVRGALGAIFMFSINMGILLSFIVGAFLHYRTAPCVMLCVPILFLISFFFLHEKKPTNWFKSNRRAYTEEDNSFEFNIEVNHLNNTSGDNNINVIKNYKTMSILLAELAIPSTRKAIIFCIALVVFNQASGCFVLLSYTASIFAEAGSNLSPNVSAIIIGIVKIFGSTLSIVLVEHYGRKLLYIVSCLGTAVGLFAMATYAYLQQHGFNIESFNWIPVVSLSFVIFIASVGILPLPFVILSELLPKSVRGIITTICICIFQGARLLF